MTIYLVLGYEQAPVLTWSYDREFALDQARINRAAVVALPVVADFELYPPKPPAAADVPFDATVNRPTWPACEHRPQMLADQAGPCRACQPTPLDTPSGSSVEGWSVGGRSDTAGSWNYTRESEEADAVVDQVRRSAGPDAAGVVSEFYKSVGVLPIEAVDAFYETQAPGVPQLRAIRDGLQRLPVQEEPTQPIARKAALPPPPHMQAPGSVRSGDGFHW